MVFNKFLIWGFWAQNVGGSWVKNGKKGHFFPKKNGQASVKIKSSC